ncbi:RhuM family protein [Ruminococcus sp.]|uniref:RhuM family protein n=1 Tax=Ruminococcus sp. TaxID=41978 RepID=UPI0038696F1D
MTSESTVRNCQTVHNEGNREVTRDLVYYNFDMILAIGYCVRSNVGIQFRRWATGILTEYPKKGFVLNDDRLRNPKEFGADYFDELLERIRDIRASERRFYQKVKDIFALSVDYLNQICLWCRLSSRKSVIGL